MFYLHFLSFHLDNFLDAFCFYLPSISFLSTYPSFSVPLCILILQFYEHVAMQTQLHSLNSGTSDIRSVTLKFGPYWSYMYILPLHFETLFLMFVFVSFFTEPNKMFKQKVVLCVKHFYTMCPFT
jgi:hypothetical protein